MHDNSNLCTTMHVTNPILFTLMCAIMAKFCVKFQPNLFGSCREKFKKL